MIFDISDDKFKNICNDKKLFLPISWNGKDYPNSLQDLYDRYIKDLKGAMGASAPLYGIQVNLNKIREVTYLLVKTANEYLNGFPSDAYATFEKVMEILDQKRLKVYQKSVVEDSRNPGRDPLRLFRVRGVKEKINKWPRKEVFHTPFDCRSRISTNRYSIAGYPCLYLGTSLELCCNEIQADIDNELYITAAYKFEREYQHSETNIRVIELGIKPQDFLQTEGWLFDTADYNHSSGRYISRTVLLDTEVRTAYLLWYPLIAACSFIRKDKGTPFSAEYIVPQLLMQWVRKQFDIEYQRTQKNLIGIRYFSCASEEDSEKGFNYVFPTSGEPKSQDFQYCPVLTKAFRLTHPVYINDYLSIMECEEELRLLGDSYYDNPDR